MFILTLISLCFAVFVDAGKPEPRLFCKCFCGSNSTVFELPLTDPKPCANCTKQFCLDNVEEGICDGIADATCPSNDFKTACFARDSFKDEMIIRSFLFLAFALVLFAAAKPYIDKWRQQRRERNQYRAVASTDY
ncbi:uncharacterized protein BYT42DRAFT_553423 [Radiomyces spectabilis]|uniref:uncharacterized protein n=1 Tax=Radiomyces spectabilis TaxID=64574 RepID=UPI00221E49AF|nr:uncharacterized protein BYT42DRAFT_553423 [Radiomyces spectabilis]KAI8394110.1 hypothetical protein BYT42DRAFT_553423 [Radiomyces spectabilis]